MTEQVEQSATAQTQARRVRRLGPGFEIDLPLTSKGLHKSADAAFGAANFYLFFIESAAGGDNSQIKELRDGIRTWRASVEGLIERWKAAVSGMKEVMAGRPFKIRDNGDVFSFECNSSDAMLLVSLYEAGDDVLKHIRLLEILKKVDAESALSKKHEIRAEVGESLRTISRLFKIAIVRLNEAKREAEVIEAKTEAETIELPDDEAISTVEADD